MRQRVVTTCKPPTALTIHDLPPGKSLYCCTDTGLVPFMSIITGPETYHLFDKVRRCMACRK